ncbi:MAG TPA: hypothetical protein VFC19_43455 [Candidatus Limnocylindrales bacterium]|nr:hypothetical protein [Candidatus Limnocylindrales bacterium]
MTGKLVSGLAAVVLAAAALSGCTLDRMVTGCTPPPNEQALLDDLAREPVLAVAPEGAKRPHEPERHVACHRLPNDAASSTEVFVRYELSRGLSRAEAVTFYEPMILEFGWPKETMRGGEGFMGYCKMVDGRTWHLQIMWVDRAVTILIFLSDPPQDPCL